MFVKVGYQVFSIIKGRTAPVVRIVFGSLREKKMIKIDARIVLRYPRLIKPLQKLFRKMCVIRRRLHHRRDDLPVGKSALLQRQPFRFDFIVHMLDEFIQPGELIVDCGAVRQRRKILVHMGEPLLHDQHVGTPPRDALFEPFHGTKHIFSLLMAGRRRRGIRRLLRRSSKGLHRFSQGFGHGAMIDHWQAEGYCRKRVGFMR